MDVEWISPLFVLQLFVAEFLFARYFQRRSFFWVRYLSCVVGCMVIAYFYPFSHGINDVVMLFLFLTLFLFTVISLAACFKSSVWNLMFVGVAAYATEHFAAKVQMLFQKMKLPYISGTGLLSTILSMLLSVTLVYTLVYFLFARRIGRGECPNVNNKQLIMISVIMIVICIMVSMVAQKWAGNTMTNIVESIYAMLSSLFILTILFGLLDRSKMQTEMETMKHLWYLEREQYKISKENIDLINIKCHDLKHHITGLMDNPSQESVQKIEEAISIYGSVLKTGNQVLDVVLTEKSLYCEKNNIRFTCMVDGEKLKGLETGELYTLFGNAIDNAIESVMKIGNKEKRVITLVVRSMDKLLSISLENYYEGIIEFEDGLPVTTKKDKDYHGFGMKSIRHFVDKYQGNLIVSAKAGIFRLSILLPID